ncbi:MAG: hypothetical protein ACFCU4_07140 [Puniceicoccaceae bacterium]
MPDFIIREPNSDNARGPFSINELRSLLEASQVSRKTLYYIESSETWEPFENNEVIRNALFPTKTKLTLRSATQPPTGKQSEKPAKAKKAKKAAPTIEELLAMGEIGEEGERAGEPTKSGPVNLGGAILHPLEKPEEIAAEEVFTDKKAADLEKILAASEGNTEDTQYLARRRRSRELAFSAANPALVISLLLTAFAFSYPSIDLLKRAVSDAAPQLLLQQPATFLALIDLILAIAIGLAATEVFPILRARAMISLGFFGLIFFSFGHWVFFSAAVASGLGLYILTLSSRFYLTLLASILSIYGAAVFAYGGFLELLQFG